MGQASVMSLDAKERRLFTTTKTWAECLVDAFFNPWKREIEVGEIIRIENQQGRKLVIIDQLDPFVKVSEYIDNSFKNDITSLIDSGTNPPDTPIAGSANFTVTALANFLNAIVRVNVGDMNATRVWVQTGTRTAPTSITDGDEVSWTGSQSFFKTFNGWSATTFYVDVYDSDDEAWVQAAGEDEDGGITAVPNDQSLPTGSITLAQKVGYETSVFTITSTWDDAQSGVDESRLLIREKGGATLFSGSAVEASLELAGSPGQSLQLELVIIDFQNNQRVVESAAVSLDDNVAVGTVAFATAQPTDGTAAFSIAEDAGPLTTDLVLTGNNAGGTPSIDVKVRLHTVDSSQLDTDSSTWTTVNGTITFAPAGDGSSDSQTLTIPLSALSPADAKIRRGELYLDESSASAGLSIGANKALLFDVSGSGGGVTAYPNDGTPYYETAIDATDYQAISGGSYGTDPTTTTFDGQTCLHQPNPDHSYNETDPAGADYFLDNAPAVFYDINFPIAGTWDLNIYGGASASNANSLWVTIDGADAFSPASNAISFTTALTLDWYKHSSTFTVAAAGVHRIGIHQREVQMPPIYRLHIGLTDSGYTAPSGAITPDTPISAGSPTSHSKNPLVPIGDIGSLDAATVVLSPQNGDDGVVSTVQPELTVPSATELLFNYASPTVTQNGAGVDLTWSSDGVSKINCDSVGWTNNATVDIDLVDVGKARVAGVWKRIPDQTSWTYDVEDTSGGSYQPFANVTPLIPAGRMTGAWFELAKAQFTTTEADDPVQWQSLYTTALANNQYYTAASEAELNSLLNNATAGDVIGVTTSVINDWTITARGAGTAANPIVVAPAAKLQTGVAGYPTTVNGGSGDFWQFANGADNYIVGGFHLKNCGLSAFRLLNGGNDGTNYFPGARGIRLSGNFFERCGVVAGPTRGFVTVGYRCHDFRYDHNASYECYNDLRWEKGPGEEKQHVTTGSVVDHNYFGPAAPDGYITGKFYEVNAIRTGNGTHVDTAPDMDVTVKWCVFDFPNQGQADNDGEMVEGKANGLTIQDCIMHSDYAYVSFRHGHRGQLKRCYLHGVGVKPQGKDLVIEDNVIVAHDSSSHKRGIEITRTGDRTSSLRVSPTEDGVVRYNSVYGFYIEGIAIGNNDGGGAIDPLSNVDTTYNYVTASEGVCIAYNNDPSLVSHTGCDFDNNYYEPTGTAGNGSAYSLEVTTPVAVPPASASGYGSRTLNKV